MEVGGLIEKEYEMLVLTRRGSLCGEDYRMGTQKSTIW